MATRATKLSELKPDPQNANRGTERGLSMLERSLRQYGAGRSILIDKHGRIVAGNKTAESAAGLGLDDVLVVETDGTKLVAVQRTDLDLLKDKAARELALADNRVGELDLDWDVRQLLADLNAGIDVEQFFREGELEALVSEMELTGQDPQESKDRKLGEKALQVKPVLYMDEVETFERAISLTGLKRRGEALLSICREYVEVHGEGQLLAPLEGEAAATGAG